MYNDVCGYNTYGHHTISFSDFRRNSEKKKKNARRSYRNRWVSADFVEIVVSPWDVLTESLGLLTEPVYCVYTMSLAAPTAPFARNVACRGVLVIYFSDFQDLLRFVTFSYVVLRYP